MARQESGIAVVAHNRRARHDFVIEDSYEAGIVLQGTEVKSLREGTCSLNEAYARPKGDEVFLFDMHIPPYGPASQFNHDPKRPRKLLLQRRELDRIIARCTERGYTLVPMRLYFKGGYAKVQIGLARRRKHWDDRDKKEARQRRKDTAAELGRRGRR
ncbi:MAG: SsrA-binding protein SmpB [Candidatus Brocadiaceae bacterium]|nr:SsrA-binding protein SmpB [Candidatus Brocadiaceae bacterium]